MGRDVTQHIRDVEIGQSCLRTNLWTEYQPVHSKLRLPQIIDARLTDLGHIAKSACSHSANESAVKPSNASLFTKDLKRRARIEDSSSTMTNEVPLPLLQSLIEIPDQDLQFVTGNSRRRPLGTVPEDLASQRAFRNASESRDKFDSRTKRICRTCRKKPSMTL